MAQLDWGHQSSAIYLLKSLALWGVQEGPIFVPPSVGPTPLPGDPYSCLINDSAHPSNVGTVGGEDGVTGLDGFEIREAAVNLVEAHGGVHGNFWAGRRPVTITLDVLGTSVAAREARLSALKKAATQFQDGRLFWFSGDPNIVSVTRENKVLDPSFENPGYAGSAPTANAWVQLDSANWASQTFQVQVGTFTGSDGSQLLRITGTKDNSATNRNIGIVSGGMPVVEGEVYSAQAKLNILNTIVSGTGWRIQMKFMDSNGTTISTPESAPLAVGASGAQTVTLNGQTVPVGAVQCQLIIYGSSTSALDVVDVQIDSVQFVQEATAGSFFSGDTANCSWLGKRWLAPSVNRPNGKQITTRLQQPLRIGSIGWKKSAFMAFVAADPFIYSSTQWEIRDLANGVARNQVENRGNQESVPDFIQILGPGSNPAVQCVSGGVTRKIAFTGLTLAGGEYINIYPKLRRCLKNGVTDVYGSIDFTNTTWWGLLPGLGNNITYSVTSGGTGATLGYLWYRDAWK